MNQKKNNTFPINLEHGKLPPQAIDLEEAVIGGILLESQSMHKVASILVPESFYKQEHQLIFQAITEMYNQNIQIDILTVPEQLRKNEVLDEVGGVAYVTQLSSRVASAAHIEQHAMIVQQKFIQRQIIAIGTEMQNRAYDEGIDVQDLVDYAQDQVHNVVKKSITRFARTISEIGVEVIQDLTELGKAERQYSGIVTTYKELDKITGGWQNSDLILLAARPSMGKTFFGLKFAMNACDAGKSVAMFSLEMSDKQLYHRELSYHTGIENSKIRTGQLNPFEWEKVDIAQGKFEKTKLIIDDTPALAVQEFKAKSLMYKKDHDVDMIVVDYIQLMKSPEYKYNRELEIGDISSTLKSVAKELDIPVIALCQLSREVEKRHDKVPILSDLRESGRLEQDADLVGFLYRPEVYDIEFIEVDKEEISTRNYIQLIIAKHRNGAIGAVDFFKNWNWTSLRDNSENKIFEDGNKDSEENEVPY